MAMMKSAQSVSEARRGESEGELDALLSQLDAVASETQSGAILSGNCSAATTQPAHDDIDRQRGSS